MRFENPVAGTDQTAGKWTLKKKVEAFLLRRLKKDVLKDLPEKLETVVYSRAETEQQTLYNAQALQLKRYLEDLDGDFGGSERLQILAQMTRLNRFARSLPWLQVQRRLCKAGYLYGADFRRGESE